MLTIDANVWIAAVDNKDFFYAESRTFLLAVARQQVRIYLPAFARIEIACTLARKRQDARVGVLLANTVLTSDYIVHVPLDSQFFGHAMITGTRALLRGADALYVATAELHQTLLVSWDDELVQRANAVTPNQWLATNPG